MFAAATARLSEAFVSEQLARTVIWPRVRRRPCLCMYARTQCVAGAHSNNVIVLE